ncbi:MAG: choice-of-anchor Q domain-containing protein [Pseudomonadota bacterium]
MPVQPKWLPAAIAAALATSQATHAAVITVDSPTDFFVVGGAACTLRTAIAAANSNSPVSGCVAGDALGVDVIEFSPDLTSSTISLQNGQLEITSSLTINALGALRGGVTIDAGGNSRVFQIDDSDDDAVQQVTLRGLTLINGSVSGASGGAIRVDGENLVLESCTLRGNTAVAGMSGNGFGGAMDIFRGEVTIVDSTISGNAAEQAGGGISTAFDPTVTLLNTELSENVARFGGGWSTTFFNGYASLTMTGGTVSDNTATEAFGGGLAFVGTAEITGVTFSGNVAASDGGAARFFFQDSDIQLTGVTMSNNTASGSGGAIDLDEGVQLSIASSELMTNTATEGGGAILAGGDVTIFDSTISGNSAGPGSAAGGAINVAETGSLFVDTSRIENNAAELAAGILSRGPLDLVDSKVSGNTATSFAGAMYTRDTLSLTRTTISGNTASDGAALFLAGDQTATLTNVTISENTSVGDTSSYPAAVFSRPPMVISNSTLIDNAPNTIFKDSPAQFWSLTNTVVAGSPVLDCVDASTPISVNLNSFIGDGTCAAGAVDLLTGDPLLGPLASNGGVTQTHLPLSGSPLVDAGTNADCPADDQTGMPRSIDGDADDNAVCDIGSVEFVDLFPPLATLTSAPDVTAPGENGTPLEVTYTELDGAVDFATIDPADLTVTPGPLTVQGVALAGTPDRLVATYTVLPPGGSWDAGDSGSYSVALNAGEVLDRATTGANPVPAGPLGGFSVAIVDLDVTGNGVSIADGDNSPTPTNGTAFGGLPTGASLTRNFAVQNAGGGTLTLTEPLEVFGAGFSTTQPAETTLGPGESATFSVTFAPAVTGQVTGQVTILSDDADENPYTFAVSGTGSDDPQAALIFADSFESP